MILIDWGRVECGHLTIFYSKPKFGRIGPKTKIFLDLFGILFTSLNFVHESAYNESDVTILILDI